MNAHRILLPVLAAGCLAAAWLALRLETEIAAFPADKASRGHADLAARLTQVKATSADLEKQLQGLQAASLPARGKADEPAAGGPAAVDPEAKRQALIAFAQMWGARGFAPVFQHLSRNLNLTDAQVGQLKELTAERLVAAWQAIQPLTRGGQPDPDAIRQAAASATAPVDAQLHQLLGDPGFAQLQQQIQVAPEEALVQQANRSLAASGSPLTDAQQDQLAQILAQNQPAAGAQNPVIAALNGLSGGGEAQLTDAALTQAAAVLPPEQVALLRQYQEVQQARKTVIQIYQQTFRTLAQAQGKVQGAAQGN